MRVLLVEDEPDLGAAIKRTLTQHKYLVDWVIDGDAAWGYLENSWTEYKLAIFDWMLPKISGLELCKRLRKHQNSLPILMLTAKDSMEDKVTGLDAGADDYLVKPFGMAELLARLRALQRRSPQFQPQKLTVGNLTLDYSNNVVCSQDAVGNFQEIILTYKEFQLLEYFMKHPNQILTTEQIRHQLWEVSAEPVSNVVAAQMRLLRRKLVNGGCENMIETLHGLGYRFNFN
ncbi:MULTISPECIES: two-component system response regulator RppA [Cyanophyceae]|uniref:two-component system response regulator RppA n=1 Tax=Cyanophyceae TaxID=3028117 RepID=UPI0023312569|nr:MULTISPECIES: two-component system response regulator RppA [Cyanophyceae]MDB9356631.1 response regulator transcription factor [Nodularia spumigena CS-587/03]MDB9341448.1 response regulator transcription factor [Nodularia spumigena CS-589/07]MDB9398570.1 response regulator transcription factor [Microcystis aeruginosa CS-567/02-A1]MDB9497995.1 response regulator transcription factor [Nodularia spumigena CS-336/02]MDB9532317.1 response regulator transcription factor [Nodularia spumigena CS-103